MRVFDKEEKNIISKITQGEGFSRNLINIFDSASRLGGVRIVINKLSKIGHFEFQTASLEPTNDEYQWIIEQQKVLTELLIKHLALIKYLEKEELVILFSPANSNDNIVTIGAGADNQPSTPMPITDQFIVDLLIEYIHKEILPSPTLRSLETNNFISDEEIHFKKQQIVAWVAISISVILGLYGMYEGNSSNLDQEAKYKVLSDEMHLLTKGVQAISIEIPNMSKAITRAQHGEKVAGEKISGEK